MKVILKHASGQYVLIVDERPRQNEWYLDDADNVRLSYVSDTTFWESRGKYCKILAHENLKGVKSIALIVDDTLITDKALVHDLLDEVTFEELEVTEEEEYWVVML